MFNVHFLVMVTGLWLGALDLDTNGRRQLDRGLQGANNCLNPFALEVSMLAREVLRCIQLIQLFSPIPSGFR